MDKSTIFIIVIICFATLMAIIDDIYKNNLETKSQQYCECLNYTDGSFYTVGLNFDYVLVCAKLEYINDAYRPTRYETAYKNYCED